MPLLRTLVLFACTNEYREGGSVEECAWRRKKLERVAAGFLLGYVMAGRTIHSEVSPAETPARPCPEHDSHHDRQQGAGYIQHLTIPY